MTTTNLASIVVGVAVVALLAARQLRSRPVSADLRVPLILGIIGLIELTGYVQKGHHGTAVIAGLAVSLVLGAAFGAARAFTMRLWKRDGRAWRQGTWVTAVLWVITVAIHFGVDEVFGRHSTGAGSLAGSSILLYLAVTYTVQRLIVQYRAQRLPLPGRQAEPLA